jgi:1,4-dihydroxy-2-naphthoate octaprenyltransferase
MDVTLTSKKIFNFHCAQTLHNTVTRFHFSYFFFRLFICTEPVGQIDWVDAVFVFFILHVLVYPSSNGYNSYMDRDETPIGGLAKPLQTKKDYFS